MVAYGFKGRLWELNSHISVFHCLILRKPSSMYSGHQSSFERGSHEEAVELQAFTQSLDEHRNKTSPKFLPKETEISKILLIFKWLCPGVPCSRIMNHQCTHLSCDHLVDHCTNQTCYYCFFISCSSLGPTQTIVVIPERTWLQSWSWWEMLGYGMKVYVVL